MTWLVLGVLLLWAVIVWLRGRDDRPRGERQVRRSAEAIDREELERAEREVREMDADPRGRPHDDVVGDDWGPGTGKTPL